MLSCSYTDRNVMVTRKPRKRGGEFSDFQLKSQRQRKQLGVLFDTRSQTLTCRCASHAWRPCVSFAIDTLTHKALKNGQVSVFCVGVAYLCEPVEAYVIIPVIVRVSVVCICVYRCMCVWTTSDLTVAINSTCKNPFVKHSSCVCL